MDEQLLSDLAAADPAVGDGYATSHDLVQQMAVVAREAAASGIPARRRWWRRRRVVLPVLVVGIAALSGGALLIPLNIMVNGGHVKGDVVIPIVYTTDTGKQISCRDAIFYGDENGHKDAADKRLAAFMAEHDWTGIGQRAYEDALAHPFVPGVDGGLSEDTPEMRDRASFSSALDRVIADETPAELRIDPGKLGTISSGASDCQGELH